MVSPFIDWNFFRSLTVGERRRFLKQHGLTYKNVPHCKICKRVFCRCGDIEYLQLIEERKKLYHQAFEKKLDYTFERTKEILLKHDGKFVLAYSSGIDSESCVHIPLIEQTLKNKKGCVINSNTGVEFPESISRLQSLEKELNINVQIAFPKTSFREIVRLYGFPIYSRSDKNPKKRIATMRCCELLKKRPMKILERESGTELLIMGLRFDENQNRRKSALQYGDYFFSKSRKMWIFKPILYWSIEDVWHFQKEYGFNYNAIYDKTNCDRTGFYQLDNGSLFQIRTGCWSCPQSMASGYLQWLRKYYPKFFEALLYKLGLVETLNKLGISVTQLMTNRLC